MDKDEEKEEKKRIRDRWSSANTWGMVGILFLLLAASRFGSDNGKYGSEIVTGQPPVQSVPAAQSSSTGSNLIQGFDPRDASYVIEGLKATLIDGISEQPIPNSSAKIITRYFGNGALGDLNGDGRDDMAYYLTQEPGGTGLFYYVVAAINLGANAQGTASYRITNPVLIGDRIAPQPSEIRVGTLYINYADRKAGEPMAAMPSVGKTKILDVNGQNILSE